jgi:O-antigen ligase
MTYVQGYNMSVTLNVGWTKPQIIRARYLRVWITTSLVIPIVLDFIFFGSPVARYSRILIFLIISASLLVNRNDFLTGKFIGFDTTIFTALLYLVGTFAGLTRGGVITPNILTLLLFMIIVGLNFDLYEVSLKAIAWSCHVLIFLSIFAIIFKLNPRGFYSSSIGYPVYFDFLGIPGRNYGVFSHPNFLGEAAALSALFLLANRKNYFLLLAPLFCIAKCGSRTSIIGLTVGFMIFLINSILKSRNSPIRRKVESPLIIGTFLLGIFVASSFQFLNYIKFLDPGTLTGRASIWQTSLSMFQKSPIVGLGWNWESRAIDSQLLGPWAVSAHNMVLEIIFSSGSLGLLLFLAILTKGVLFFNRLWSVEKIVLVTILISGISEAYIDLQYPTIQTFLLFLIILGANKERQSNYD